MELNDSCNPLINQLNDTKNITYMISGKTRFRFIKRVINIIIRVTARCQQSFNNTLVSFLEILYAETLRLRAVANEKDIIGQQTNQRCTALEQRTGNGEKRLDQAEKSIRELQSRMDGIVLAMHNNSSIVDRLNDSVSYVSYAQVGEDRILNYILNHIRVEFRPDTVTYLDIGSNNYAHANNTYSLYRQGYRGVLVEANPSLIEQLKLNRPRDVVVNMGIGAESGKKIPFYSLTADGVSSFNKAFVDSVFEERPDLGIEETYQIELITINELIEAHFNECPTVISIDIEGDEYSALSCFDFMKYRPIVFVVEMIPFKRHITIGTKCMDIVELMDKNEYEELAFTGVNSVFVDRNKLDHQQ